MVIIGKSLRTKWKPQKRHTCFFPEGTGGRISLVMVMAAWIMLDPQHFDSVWVIKFLRKNGTTHGPLSAFISYFTISTRQRSTFLVSKCCLRAGKSGQMIIPKVPENFRWFFWGDTVQPWNLTLIRKLDGFARWFSFQIWLFEYLKVHFREDDSMKIFHPSQWKKNPSLQLGVKFPAYLEIRLDDW